MIRPNRPFLQSVKFGQLALNWAETMIFKQCQIICSICDAKCNFCDLYIFNLIFATCNLSDNLFFMSILLNTYCLSGCLIITLHYMHGHVV